MALSDPFRKLWKDVPFRQNVTAVIIDEAHVIDEWGGDDFRPQYRKIDELRVYTGQEVPFVACTATASTSTFEMIWKTLGFGSRPFWGIDVGCQRANLTFITRKITYPDNPIFDVLNTLFPARMDATTRPEEIDKSLLYFDSEGLCSKSVAMINRLLPAHLRGIVHSYSSTLSKRAKDAIWDGFRSGRYRIICATDAAGMGCNVPDIQNTVVFGLPHCPKSISTVIQRWGRTGRDRTITGTCQLLVPEWAFRPEVVTGSGLLAKKPEPKKYTRQREALQPALEKLVNARCEDPTDGECCNSKALAQASCSVHVN